MERPETDLFTVIAGFNSDEDRWELYTGFAGPSAPKEPTDPSLSSGSSEGELRFWSRHALVWGEGWEAPFEASWSDVLAYARVLRAKQASEQ